MTLIPFKIRSADGTDRDVVLDSVTGESYLIPVHRLAIGEESSAPTFVSANNPVPIALQSFLLDAFGRLRVSDTGQRFDVEFIHDKQPLLVDEVLAGGGSAIHNANTRDVTLAVGDAADATQAALYSHYDVPYTAGNSQLIDITGTLDDADIEGGTAYVFLRSKISGTVAEVAYAQSAWEAGTSGIDWTKSHILQIDFQSLKVGRIQFKLVQSGLPVKIKEITNDNIRDSGYWQSPTLPVFWRIYNDATYTYAEMGYGDTDNAVGIRYRIAANASATMRAICTTVKSEGGTALLEMPGYPFSADNGVTAVTVADSLIPILSLRVGANINSLTNRGLYIPTGFSVAADNALRYAVVYRPTLTDASWTAVNATHSGMEYDVSATALSGGVIVASDYFVSGRNSLNKTTGLLDRVLMSQGRIGTPDILTIAGIRTTGSSAATRCAIGWKEIR